MSTTTTTVPEVIWAQRSSISEPTKNVIYLTIHILDPENPKIDLTSTSLNFTSVSGGTSYALTIDFFDEIDVKKSKYEITGSNVFFILVKSKLSSDYWPRLTKLKLKYHYIKTDFDRWCDEDEQESADNEDLHNSLNDLSSFNDNSNDPIDFAKLASQYKGGSFPTGDDLSMDQFSSSDDDEEKEEENLEGQVLEEADKKD